MGGHGELAKSVTLEAFDSATMRPTCIALPQKLRPLALYYHKELGIFKPFYLTEMCKNTLFVGSIIIIKAVSSI